MNNYFFPESNFFNSKYSYHCKSSSKRNNNFLSKKSSKDENFLKSKDKKLFSSSSSGCSCSSYIKLKLNSKEKTFENNKKIDDLDLNENDSILSFSKIKDINSSEFYSDGKRADIKAKKIIKKNSKKDIKIIISNNKVINQECENKENINNGNILTKKRKRPKHTDLFSDNLKEKIKTSFFNSIINMVNDDLKKFKNLRPNYIIPNIEKIMPILDSLKKKDNFKNALSKKVKYIFYTNEFLEKFLNKSFKNKKDFKNKLNGIILGNNKNKEIINKIEEICKKLNEEKNTDIKIYASKLNEIFNIKVKDIYLKYLNNKKYFANFHTLENEIEKLRKKGKDNNYLKLFKQKAFELCKEIK